MFPILENMVPQIGTLIKKDSMLWNFESYFVYTFPCKSGARKRGAAPHFSPHPNRP